MGTMKKMLRKVLPLRSSTYEKRQNKTESRLNNIEQNQQKILELIKESASHTIAAESEGFSEMQRSISETQSETNEIASIVSGHTTDYEIMRSKQVELQMEINALNELLNDKLANALSILGKLENGLSQVEEIRTIDRSNQVTMNESRKIDNEILWGQVFNQAIDGCEWLEKKPFRPGRWAAGYPLLYCLFCTLEALKPKRILDIGLGQSSAMIAHYANHYDDVCPVIVEHDPSWADFFQSGFSFPKNSTIEMLDLEMREIEGCIAPVRSYAGFLERINQHKYDLIIVDGPSGEGMDELSRIDAVDLIPDHLAESFVIILDDYNRQGERNTAELFRAALNDADVEFSEGVYRGSKETLLMASNDYAFLTSQ